MAIKKTQNGFALLVAVIFMSVMLSLGLSLGALGYKQQVLASSATESQYAFYVADAALECALYADQQQRLFAYPASDPSTSPAITCDNSAGPVSVSKTWSSSYWTVTNRLSLNSGAHCADVTVYKYKEPLPNNATTYIFSQGYNASCATVSSPGTARFSARGIHTKY